VFKGLLIEEASQKTRLLARIRRNKGMQKRSKRALDQEAECS
jgi:hypothetical protein